MQTDRVEPERADGGTNSSRNESRDDRESVDAPLSADESGVTSRADLMRKERHFDDDKQESGHDAELTIYHSNSSNEWSRN